MPVAILAQARSIATQVSVLLLLAPVMTWKDCQGDPWWRSSDSRKEAVSAAKEHAKLACVNAPELDSEALKAYAIMLGLAHGNASRQSIAAASAAILRTHPAGSNYGDEVTPPARKSDPASQKCGYDQTMMDNGYARYGELAEFISSTKNALSNAVGVVADDLHPLLVEARTQQALDRSLCNRIQKLDNAFREVRHSSSRKLHELQTKIARELAATANRNGSRIDERSLTANLSDDAAEASRNFHNYDNNENNGDNNDNNDCTTTDENESMSDPIEIAATLEQVRELFERQFEKRAESLKTALEISLVNMGASRT